MDQFILFDPKDFEDIKIEVDHKKKSPPIFKKKYKSKKDLDKALEACEKALEEDQPFQFNFQWDLDVD